MLLVSDANIFIDLEKIGLLNFFSQLDIKISTSDFVFNELNTKQQEIVKMLDIQIYELDPNELITFYNEYNALGQVKISSQDYSIFYFAKKYDAYLLSNDKALRNFSKKHNVTIKGLFYILDLIIDTGKLAKKDLQKSIKLLYNNKRKPEKEIKKRLERLT